MLNPNTNSCHLYPVMVLYPIALYPDCIHMRPKYECEMQFIQARESNVSVEGNWGKWKRESERVEAGRQEKWRVVKWNVEEIEQCFVTFINWAGMEWALSVYICQQSWKCCLFTVGFSFWKICFSLKGSFTKNMFFLNILGYPIKNLTKPP